MIRATTTPFLAAVLRSALPERERLDLLKACLLPGAAGKEAFLRWHGYSDDPRRLLAESVYGGRLLGALLWRAAESGGWELDPALRTHLKVVVDHEKRRSAVYRDVLLEAHRALQRNGVRYVALKGADLSFSVYPEPWLRHSHDIDILVPPADLSRAADMLRDAGFSRPPESNPILDVHRTWVHPCGLPVQLHRWPYFVRGYGEVMDDTWPRAGFIELHNERIPVFGRADALIHSIVHASTGNQRSSMVWVPDAFFAAQAVDDWAPVGELAARDGLGLPTCVALTLLRDAFGVPVPDDVITRANDSARRDTRFQREVALHGLLPGRRAIWRATSTLAERFFVLRWTVLPSPQYLGWRTNRTGWSLAWLYLARPLAWLGRRIRQSSIGSVAAQ